MIKFINSHQQTLEDHSNVYKNASASEAMKNANMYNAPLAGEQRCPAQEVWLGYLRFASLKGHGSGLCVLSHGYLAGN